MPCHSSCWRCLAGLPLCAALPAATRRLLCSALPSSPGYSGCCVDFCVPVPERLRLDVAPGWGLWWWRGDQDGRVWFHAGVGRRWERGGAIRPTGR